MRFHAYMMTYQISNSLKLGLNRFTLVTTLIYTKNKAQKRALLQHLLTLINYYVMRGHK